MCKRTVNINFFILPTQFLQPVNLAILTIWSLFHPIAVPAPHLLSLFLAHLSYHWKSQIAHSDMHHHVSGINSLIHSVSLASHVSTHLLIHLSAHLYYHHHFRHPSLLQSFAPGSKPTFSTNPSHLGLLLPTGLPSWQRDWTGPIMLIVLFLVSHFNFLFVPCGRLSWLPVCFLLHVKYTVTHYRIVSYRFNNPACRWSHQIQTLAIRSFCWLKMSACTPILVHKHKLRNIEGISLSLFARILTKCFN